jgi:2-dehydro-3-deoxygluconokinase
VSALTSTVGRGSVVGPVVTAGEAIVALAPTAPVLLHQADALKPYVGGAELNFAVGLRRLRRAAIWIGVIGDDPMGALVRQKLAAEDVDDSRVVTVPGGRTAMYLREWLPDGRRRPLYYRLKSVADALAPALWPNGFHERPAWVHVTGITPALGTDAAALVERATEWAVEHGVPVSLDPNFRPALWNSAAARQHLLRLAERADVVLMSEEDSELLFETAEPRRALPALLELGPELGVLKRGAHGATLLGRNVSESSTVAPSDQAIDPVGAGDGFDAGFVAGLLSGGSPEYALEVGAFMGARAVEAVGEHTYPHLEDLPIGLREGLASSGSHERKTNPIKPRSDTSDG